MGLAARLNSKGVSFSVRNQAAGVGILEVGAPLQNSLLEFVRETVEQLSLGEDLHEDLPAMLEFLRGNLEETYARYEPPAPEGAEAIRDAMLESIDLFCNALDCLEQYGSRPNKNLLSLAVNAAEEANDLLDQVDYIIEQSQQWISQFSQV